MKDAPTDALVPEPPKPAFISEAVEQIVDVFDPHPHNVRIWRYVDSQVVLFGCITDGGEQRGEPNRFDERVAFLKDPSILSKYSSDFEVLQLSDDMTLPPELRHPLWYVPNYNDFNKKVRTQYVEALLLAGRHDEQQPLRNLVGVVCIDVPYATYEGLDPNKRAVLDKTLIRLRDELRNYSNSLLRKGFDDSENYLRATPRTRDEERATDNSFVEPLRKLRTALAPGAAIVSLYLRSVNSSSDEVPLGDGIGEYYEQLLIVETCHRTTPGNQFPQTLFSAKAAGLLGAKPNAPPPPNAVLFPGSDGSWETFNDYQKWFTASRNALKEIPRGSDRDGTIRQAADWVYERAKAIETNGSFGVFPIRCMAETSLRGQLVGLLCVAVEDKRNFFTWSRRLVIEKFCRMTGRVHDAYIAPVLSRVHPKTHSEVIASPPKLAKLLEGRGPLGPPTATHGSAKVERTCMAFVVSVDIRKSTDLMLKVLPGRTREYGDELMKLCNAMREAMEDELGVFDKFTGDGVLAFFPEFFSGNITAAGYRLLTAAKRCHETFAATYKDFWPHLVTVTAPGTAERDIPGAVGLGIGIDYGKVRLVNVGDELMWIIHERSKKKRSGHP